MHRRDLRPVRLHTDGLGDTLFAPLEARMLLVFNPSADEQYMLELLNNMRTHPEEALAIMTSSLGDPARSSDPDIDSALRFFQTKGTTLAAQWALLSAAQPLAWNEKLYNAAEGHNNAMIAADQQTHQAPGEPALGQRATNAGYTSYTLLGENVYAFAESVLHGHAGFAIDWGGPNGPDPAIDGIQNPPGHRDNMMDPRFREVGIRIQAENNNSTTVGPLVISQEFGNRANLGNPWVLGVAYNDGADDGYTPGDGVGNVTVRVASVTPGGPEFMTTTMSAGGYQLQAPAGTYNITFSGGVFGDGVTYQNIVVGFQNVKVDAERSTPPPAPDIEVFWTAADGQTQIAIDDGDSTPSTTDGTNVGDVNISFAKERIFTIRNRGDAVLRLTGAVTITSNDAVFTIVDQPDDFTLDPGQEVQFTVEIDTDVRKRVSTGTVRIASDDPNEGDYDFLMRARGVIAPTIQVAGMDDRVIADGDTTPEVSDGTGFGDVNIVLRSKTRVFTINNQGSARLDLVDVLAGTGVSFVTITGLAAADFRIITQPTPSLLPGESTTFTVRFNPDTAGVKRATITLRSNDAENPTFDFDIRGNAVAKPILQLSGNGRTIATDAPPSIDAGTDFGSAAVGGGRVLRTFSIRNIGSAIMNFATSASARVTILGGVLDFEVVRQPPRSIGIGQTATFRVRFDPDIVDLREAVVRIATLNGGNFSFNVAGTGV